MQLNLLIFNFLNFFFYQISNINNGGVSHCGLPIYIKTYLSYSKSRIMETQIIHHAKIYIILKKYSLKEPKTLQHIITLLQLIPSFNTSQNIIFQKSSYKNK